MLIGHFFSNDKWEIDVALDLIKTFIKNTNIVYSYAIPAEHVKQLATYQLDTVLIPAGQNITKELLLDTAKYAVFFTDCSEEELDMDYKASLTNNIAGAPYLRLVQEVSSGLAGWLIWFTIDKTIN